jgi:hypothetical protein
MLFGGVKNSTCNHNTQSQRYTMAAAPPYDIQQHGKSPSNRRNSLSRDIYDIHSPPSAVLPRLGGGGRTRGPSIGADDNNDDAKRR